MCIRTSSYDAEAKIQHDARCALRFLSTSASSLLEQSGRVIYRGSVCQRSFLASKICYLFRFVLSNLTHSVLVGP